MGIDSHNCIDVQLYVWEALDVLLLFKNFIRVTHPEVFKLYKRKLFIDKGIYHSYVVEIALEYN